MSHSDQFRQLINLVENNEKNGIEKLLAEVTNVLDLVKHARESWFTLVMQAWREFGGDPFVHPTQEEFSHLTRLLETRLARQLKSLERSLEEIRLKLNELVNSVDKSIPKSPTYYRQQFEHFFDVMRNCANGIASSIEILEEEGYYHQSAYQSIPKTNPWAYHYVVSDVYDFLTSMRDECYSAIRLVNDFRF